MRIALEMYVNCVSSSGAATAEWHILYAPVVVMVTFTAVPEEPPPTIRGPPMEQAQESGRLVRTR